MFNLFFVALRFEYKHMKANNFSLLHCLLVSIFMLISSSGISKANNDTQVTFIITKMPVYTPPEDTIYMATSLNQWTLTDKNYIFHAFPDGTLRLTLNITKGAEMRFKVNRGAWASAEGTEGGEFLENRSFTAQENQFEFKFEVKTWEDLHKVYFPPVKIKVVSLPLYTPSDAKIYVSGSFNGWRAVDPDYELHKVEDGTYEGYVGKGFDQFEYKFNRGNMDAWEGRFDGGPKSNRSYVNRNKNAVIIAEIESWEDLSTGTMWKKMIFILLLIEALKIIFVAVSFTRSPYPFLILAIIFCGFFFRFIYSGAEGFNFFQKGFLIPAITYGFLGPLLYRWLEADYATGRFKWVYLLPTIPFAILLPFLFYSAENFHSLIVDNRVDYLFVIFYSFGLTLNLVYGYQALKLIKKMKKEIAEWKYLLFKGWAIVCWITLGLFFIAGLLVMFKLDVKLIKDWLENFIWMALGVLIILLETKALLYFLNYAIKGKIKTYEPSDLIEQEDDEDSWTILRPRLVYLMEEKSVFTNAKLSLSDLAQALGTNTNYVSRLLNEGLKTSFADYVNAYRIKHFIKILKEDKDQSKTFLFHAYNSGFNSKSAFNRAFKKYTGKTPSEYFVNLDVPDLEGN